MIVRFTKYGAAAFWRMVCNPSNAQFMPEDWYRPENLIAEFEVAKLHKFADTRLCVSKKVVITGRDGQPKEAEEKEFTDGFFSLRDNLQRRAGWVIDHYRSKSKEGKGRLLPIHFAELEAGINNKGIPTDAANLQVDDPDDAEELQKARELLAAQQAVERG